MHPRLISTNPATGEVVGEVEITTDVARVVVAAREAQANWGKLQVDERVRILERFIDLVYQRRDCIAELICREAGKPKVEALANEVLVVLSAAKFVAKNAARVLADESLASGNPILKTKRGRLVRDAHGVIGIISPWNYAFSIPATETIAALAMGNAVVIKPSEFTPLCADRLRDLLREAGVPHDVIATVHGYGDVGTELVNSPIDKLIFTGSVATGKRVAEDAAKRLLPVVLELGGKDAMVVLDDADIDVVSSGAVWGAFTNAGQACLSVERCYVQRPIYDRFVEACAKKAAKLRVGNGMDPQIDVGPMINERQVARVEGQVREAVESGARLVCGGNRLLNAGPNFFAPTVLGDCAQSMGVMREETFGPVMPIAPFETEDEAVALANDSDFGLAASVWTSDPARGEALALRINAGTVMVNDALSCFGVAEAPHGGFKNSGIGRTHGMAGLQEMVRTRYVSSDLAPRTKKAWWFSYTPELSAQISAMLDALYSTSVATRVRAAMTAMQALKRKDLL